MEEEAHEFFKMICDSEYEMLDQLHKTLARISLLSLLINLKSHRELLLKVLNDAHTPRPRSLGGIINNITTSCHLSFSEDEVPTEGRTHNQPLHITAKCGGYMIAKVVIYNGSSLKVMPKATLDKLYLPGSTPLLVKAFDGSKWEVMDEITLPICIGPKTFDITFQVMDIWLAYSCLLGRLWIHAAEAVPSSLHQKVKFVANGQLISVMGEIELMISILLPTEYIEGDEEALETSFQAFEIIGIPSAEAEGGDPKPSRVTVMTTKVLINNSFQPGKGLGKELHDIVESVVIEENLGRARIGYTGAMKKERWGQKDLSNGGTISPEQIAVIEDQPPKLAKWIDNTTLTSDNTSESNRTDEGDDLEEEDLEEFEKLLEQERLRLQYVAEEIEVINVGEEGEVKEIWRLVKLLKEYADIFAWSYRDMLGLDITIVEHKLSLIPNAIPVCQQLRRMKPEVALKIKEEVGKQWNTTNIVSVPKKDEKVQMCIDYRDLNRASPKDNFPLPHIDMLVDNTTQHAFYSFMDDFSRYNQI
ncbi:hypothetical protein CR513_09070, partial [Mucuna pruriens]